MVGAIQESFTYVSADGQTPIHALCWLPAESTTHAPRAIVQLVHGMEEYIGRYDAFARFLAAQGFAVCGNDHLAHGESLAEGAKLSHLPLDGARIMLADMHRLRCDFSDRFPANTPYYMFGHSMGSFALRCYLARYGQGLAGAILCGTGDVPAAASLFGGWLARRLAAKHGVDSYSPFINGLADGGYAKQISQARTKFDWLNTDPAKVDDYIADPLCGEPFTVGGYASLMDLTAEACSRACTRKAPSGLPLLFISGEADPVGGHDASGVKTAFMRYKKHSETKPRLRLYPHMRHEILNEPAHDQVYADVLDWLEETIHE